MGYIYKPQTRKGVVFLAPNDQGPPVITSSDGRTFRGVPANQRGGVFYGHEGYQYVFDNDVLGLKDATLTYGNQSQKLGDTNMSYRGDALGSLSESSKGAVGDYGGGSYGGPYAPTPYGEYGVVPQYIGDQFPDPVFTKYKNIKTAPYQYTDPLKFAESFGNFNRNEILKNYDLSKGLALDTIDTELAALKGFVPAASALKRQETSIDNLFNQFERSRQVDTALPGVRESLDRQGARAERYAEGKALTDIEDRAFEVSNRSRAADIATTSGFGPRSNASLKASDLMSVEERINLSRYGDQLLNQNIQTKASLLLAPTEYSDAGSQVRVNPTVSPAQLINQGLNAINELTTISPTTGLNSVIQQNQFTTGLEQNTRQFNAGNRLQNDQFNANSANNFALQKFNYDAAFAGVVAGVGQNNINTQMALDQQQQYQNIFRDYLGQAQSAQQTNAIAGIIGSLFGSGAIPGIIGAISDFFGNDKPKGANDTGFGAQVTVPPGASPPPGYTPVQTDTDGNTVYVPGDFNNTVSPSTGPTGTENLPPDAVQPPPQPTETWTTDTDNVYNTQAARISPTLANKLVTFSAQSGIPAKALSTQSAKSLEGLEKASDGILQSAGVSSTPAPGMIQAGVDISGNPVYVSQALNQSNNPNAGSDAVKALKSALDPTGVLTSKDASTLNQIGSIASNVGFLANLDAAHRAGDNKAFTNLLLNRLGYPAAQSLVNDPQNKAGVASAFTAFNLYQNWDRMSATQKSLGLAHLGLAGYKFASGKDLASQPIIKQAVDSAGNVITPGLNVGQALNLLGTGYNIYNLIDNWDQYSTIQKVAGGVGNAASVASIAKQFGLLKPESTLGKAAGVAGGVAGVALGAKAVSDGWGKGGTRGAVQGALGGTSIVAGLSLLGYSNPYTAAAIIATSVLGDTIKTGKSKDQLGRDAVRSNFKANGLADGEYQIALPDGSLADIGIDGHGGTHEAVNKDQLVGRKNGKLSAYDIDYTNDLDYASGMGGIALSRLINGGKNKQVDQLGNQLGNAGLGRVGYGKEMSQENFNTVMQNQRAMYAKAGIKSKADAYSLTDKLLKEGRIDQIDAVQMQQAFNMMYDREGYSTAQRLMNGRSRGAEVAAKEADVPPKPKIETPKIKVTDTRGNKFDVRNVPGFKEKGSTQSQVAPVQKPVLAPNVKFQHAGIPTLLLSKEEAKKANKSRFSRPAQEMRA